MNARAHSEHELLELGLNAIRRRKHPAPFICPALPDGRLARRAAYPGAKREGAVRLVGVRHLRRLPDFAGTHSRRQIAPAASKPCKPFTYWRSHHVTVNLVILNDQDTGYALDLHNAIHAPDRRAWARADSLNQRDGIFVLRTDQLQPADKILFETVAGVILDEKNGTLAEHALRLTLPAYPPAAVHPFTLPDS